ncbi:hypothetical protein, partial [Acinetobacter baumannii]|uniref:hypothetical protein n=1 Tax=Acinetobacter baumannii TaxID=470 RepID=UPI00197AE7DF
TPLLLKEKVFNIIIVNIIIIIVVASGRQPSLRFGVCVVFVFLAGCFFFHPSLLSPQGGAPSQRLTPSVCDSLPNGFVPSSLGSVDVLPPSRR